MTKKKESGGIPAAAEYTGRRQGAELLGVSLSTFIRVEKREADFPRPSRFCNRLLYRIADLKAWAASKTVAAPATQGATA